MQNFDQPVGILCSLVLYIVEFGPTDSTYHSVLRQSSIFAFHLWNGHGHQEFLHDAGNVCEVSFNLRYHLIMNAEFESQRHAKEVEGLPKKSSIQVDQSEIW